ncbi:MAG: NUDIX domain-containing protein [Desulfurococcales archaeon]|nr:NUDIX domain-containing protein [Desulfurococcales archaeon]
MRRRGQIKVRSRCIAVDNNGRLLVERTPEGTLEIPGGRVEYEETIPFCLVREMREEAGVEAEPKSLVYVVEFRGIRRGRRSHEVLFYFKCALRGSLKSRSKGLSFHWIEPDHIDEEFFWPRPLLPYIRMDSPSFDVFRFLVINNNKLEYVMSSLPKLRVQSKEYIASKDNI